MPFSFVSKSSKSDHDLLEEYRHSRDINLVSELFIRYSHLIFGVCLKYLKDKQTSEDAVMYVFEVMKEKLTSHQVDNLGGWIHITTRNHCLMQLRSEQMLQKKEKRYQVDMELTYELHQNNREVPEATMRQLKNCLAKLSTEQRRCVELFYFSQKCYKEVANLTGFNLGKVKSYLQNAKRNLKICLETNEG